MSLILSTATATMDMKKSDKHVKTSMNAQSEAIAALRQSKLARIKSEATPVLAHLASSGTRLASAKTLMSALRTHMTAQQRSKHARTISDLSPALAQPDTREIQAASVKTSTNVMLVDTVTI